MKNKYIIITGAGGFVGSYFATHLLKKNFNLILIDNNKRSLNKLKKQISHNSYLKSYYFFEDISKEKTLIRYLNFSKKTNITGLINLAAIDAKPKKNTKYITAKQLILELGAGLVSAYLMTRYFGEDMFKKGFGRIVNIGSDYP